MHDSANVQMSHKLAEESTDRYLARLVRNAEPMVCVAGPAPATREGRPGPKFIGDDTELMEKTKHVRKPKERLMEFYARTGIGAHQVRTLSKPALTALVQTVSANANEDVKPPQAGAFGRPAPQKFLLEA
jgi:hypothetical protein